MAGSSGYQQRKHRRITGLVDAVRASKCFKCKHLVASAEVFKGWCVSCMAAWGATHDPLVVEAARLSREQVLAAEPPTARAYQRLKERIANRRPDEWFLPMCLYIGNVTVGQLQANWNFLQAMYELEVMTSAHAFKMGKESHDVLHLCGRHAPMQSISLASFMARVKHTQEVWTTIEPRIREYVQDFISQQGSGFQVLTTPRTRVSRVAARGDKTKRLWRRDPNYKSRSERAADKRAWAEKYAAPIKPIPAFWPFAVRQAPAEHDMLHVIDAMTRRVPEQWRQDVCQDLVVAVLSGEVSLANLRDALPKYLREVFKAHPIKYGPLSIHAPFAAMDDRTLEDVLVVESNYLHEAAFRARHSVHDHDDGTAEVWHEGWDRPKGLATMGEVLRSKHGTLTVDHLHQPDESEMDPEVAEVYHAEQRRRGSRLNAGR